MPTFALPNFKFKSFLFRYNRRDDAETYSFYIIFWVIDNWLLYKNQKKGTRSDARSFLFYSLTNAYTDTKKRSPAGLRNLC